MTRSTQRSTRAAKPRARSTTPRPPKAGVSARPPAPKAADWRDQTLARLRALILEAEPALVEERKWKKPSNAMAGVPVWSHPEGGIVCTGETYKNTVKLTFARGAALPDPSRLFNAGLDGGTRRAIDLREGEKIDAKWKAAFKALVRAAAELAAPARTGKPARVKLLAGGNPRIAKADGDAPVRAYIDAMPGWKRATGERLDALIVRAVPGVRKAVKWNSPFFGVEGQGWFLAFHTFTRYVKVTFFRGTSLRPVPPGGKAKEARWIDIHEDDLDEAQLRAWVKQAAALPGWLA